VSAAADPPAPRRRWIVLLPLLVFGGLGALLLLRLFAGDPSRLPSALVGRDAPQFELPAMEGLRGPGGPVPGLARADLGSGKVTLVNVWASWCVPCRDEHPLLMELARRGDVEVVGINYKDDPDNARRFLGALGNPFSRVGADLRGRAAIDWGVYGVPETFVIGPDGTIAYKHIGPITADSLRGILIPEIEKAAGG